MKRIEHGSIGRQSIIIGTILFSFACTFITGLPWSGEKTHTHKHFVASYPKAGKFWVKHERKSLFGDPQEEANIHVDTFFPPADRIVAIGEVHDDVDALRSCLELSGLISNNDTWIGDKKHLVQLGDVLVMGNGERHCMDLFFKLKEEAREAGGQVLLGNHNVVNVDLDFEYVTQNSLEGWRDHPKSGSMWLDIKTSLATEGIPAYVKKREQAFRRASCETRRLARMPVNSFVTEGRYEVWLTDTTTSCMVLEDSTVHVLNEDRDDKILPTTLRMTEVEDKFLDKLNITFQRRLLTVVNHTDINQKEIHVAVHILLRNMKSESALTQACESFMMQSNDIITRLLVIFFLSACCFFWRWQPIITSDAKKNRLSYKPMITGLRSLSISERNHEPLSAHTYPSYVVHFQGSLVTRMSVLVLVCLWTCPQIQANRNAILNHDNYASAQWMNLPPNTVVSLLIQGDATETVDHDNHDSTSFSLACPRWWQAKVDRSKSGDPFTNAATEPQVIQFVNVTALASCQINTTLGNIRNYSFLVEIWSPSGPNGIHHFFDTVALVYDSYNLVTTTKEGFSVMVCLAGECWDSSFSTSKRRWETRNWQRKRQIKVSRLNSEPINCDYFCLVNSSDYFERNESLVLQDPVSFISDFKTVDILQQSTGHDKNQKTEHLIKPLSLSDIDKHREQNESLVLRSFSQTNNSLAVLLRHLEKELGCQVSMHLYISPASLGALNIHNDSYDVLVYHAFGHKIWTLCKIENQCKEIELGPGELLYISAGTLHSARTSETSNYSMSWTFGLLRPGYEIQSLISASQASHQRRGDCHPCCWTCCAVCGQNLAANSAACSYHGTARQYIHNFDYGTCNECGQSPPGPWICISCNPGWTGATCDSPICRRGEYFQDGGCNQCAAGTFSNIDAAFLQDCIQCTAGFYQDQLGQTSCKQCPTGHYVDGAGATACVKCPSGKYLDTESNDALSDCIACAAGKYSVIHGSSSNTACLDCKAWTYSTAVSATSISTCITCPSDSNSPAGSSAVTNCTCNVGYSGPDGDTCTACVAGKYKASTGSAATGVGSAMCSCGRLCQPLTGTSSGTISVGTSEYVDNMSCYWLIASKGLISLLFSSFDTEECCDFVTINRCTSSSCSTVEQVAKLSGSGGVDTTFKSSTGYMQVLFKTDGSIRGSGIVATWSITYNDTCTDCGTGTYSTAVGSSVNSTCIACPSNSDSPAGSSVVTNCTCNVGYSGPDGDSCTACMPGKYKESTGSAMCTDCGSGTYSTTGGASGNSTCIACPSNSNSPVASPALASCTCNTGYWGSDGGPCTACLVGTVKTSTGSANCTDCGSGTYSTATGATVCTSCGVGTYSATVSASATSTCIACPSNSNSPAGSTVLTHCSCNPGFTGQNGETCTACVAGKHKESAGSANCMACAAGKYSVIHGSSSVSTCLNCPPGKYLDTESNYALSDCIACAAGKYSFIHGSPSVTTCLNCPPGKYLETESNDALSDCVDCKAWTYSTAVCATSISTCITCPSDSNSPAGSSAVTNCTCNVGYSGPDGDTCTACVAGKYKASTGSAATGVGSAMCSCGRLCQPLTGTSSGTISVGTSEYVDNMSCYWLIASKGLISLLFSSFDTEECCDFVTINRCTSSSCSTVEQVAKLSGSGGVDTTFKSSTGYMQVLFKTDGSIRGSGIVATWSITYNDTCTDCGTGTYSTAVGSSVNSTCIACPSNSDSPAGSSVVTNCTCNVGYSGPDGDSCTACMPGKYKESTGSAMCTDCGSGTYSTTGGASGNSTCIACPSNSNSPVASPALASCTCNTGYWGSDGGPCTACLVGTVKTSTGSANCTDCGSGTYSTATGATVCTSCGVGTYSATVSASATSTCIACPSNSNSPAGSTVLTHCSCNPGFTGQNGETCTACVAGKHKESAGSANCMACAAGKYSVIHGSSSVSTCLNCPPGKYLDTESNYALSDCIACAAGKYSFIHGSPSVTTCLNCPPGKYLETESNDALSDCVDCKAWTYSTAVSATSISTCITCPSDSSSPAGSSMLSDCIDDEDTDEDTDGMSDGGEPSPSDVDMDGIPGDLDAETGDVIGDTSNQSTSTMCGNSICTGSVVGGSVLLIVCMFLSVRYYFRYFQSKHLKTPDIKNGVTAVVGFIIGYPFLTRIQALVRRTMHSFKLQKAAVKILYLRARGQMDRCKFLRYSASLQLQRAIRRAQHRACYSSYLQALKPASGDSFPMRGEKFGQGPRVALCIGIEDYPGHLKLPNCLADAVDMCTCCQEQLGFHIVKFLANPNKEGMLKALEELIELLEEGSLVVFLFSGHGAEHKGVNYLLPLGMTSYCAEDYKDQAVSLDFIVETLRQGPSSTVNVILLDCCRENEKNQTFEKSAKGDENRTESAGCARIEPEHSKYGGQFALNMIENYQEKGIVREKNAEFLFGYACDPGQKAFSHKTTRNSNYTGALLRHLPVPFRTLEDSMKAVLGDVLKISGNVQRPWHSTCLFQSVVLVQCVHAAGGQMCPLSLMQEVAEPWSMGVDSMLNLVLLMDGATMARMTQREQGLLEAAVAGAAGVSAAGVSASQIPRLSSLGLLGHIQVSIRVRLVEEAPGYTAESKETDVQAFLKSRSGRAKCKACHPFAVVVARVRQAVQSGQLNLILAGLGAAGLDVSLLNMSGCLNYRLLRTSSPVAFPPNQDPEEAGAAAEAGAALKAGVTVQNCECAERHGRAAGLPCTAPLPPPTPCTQNLRESSRETTMTDKGLYVVPQWTPAALYPASL